jgi:phosphopantetheine--protein transferase-like protein
LGHNEILGIGVDIENIDRFTKDEGIDKHFLRLIFTDNEIKQTFSMKVPAPSLAAKFA